MAITLETVAAPGATPIVANAASQKAFDNNYYKLGEPNISMVETKAIMIDAMIYVLTAAGGANYKSNHKGLRQDAAVYTRGISNLDPWIALTATSVAAAHVADATFSYDLNALRLEVRTLAVLPEQTLDRIIAFLGAQLGL
jgi:hypothetical protein